MKKYLITLNICVNGRKISAIKDLRSALGVGLVEGKHLCETPLKRDEFVDSYGGNLIVNAQQLANLVILCRRDAQYTSFGYDNATFQLDSIEELVQNTLDVSTLMPLEQ